MSASMVDQDVSHCTSRDRKKMCLTLPLDMGLIDQRKVRFVHEGCRLNGVAGSLVPHQPAGDRTQLGIEEIEQLISGLAIVRRAGADIPQDPADFMPRVFIQVSAPA